MIFDQCKKSIDILAAVEKNNPPFSGDYLEAFPHPVKKGLLLLLQPIGSVVATSQRGFIINIENKCQVGRISR